MSLRQLAPDSPLGFPCPVASCQQLIHSELTEEQLRGKEACVLVLELVLLCCLYTL